MQADADIVIFGGMGLIFDDYHQFRTCFENAGVFPRTVMFVNQASDPIVERLLVPDSGNKLHPTQKPLPALLPLIETFSAPGGLVLDPFAGSGSTLLAARMLGRDYLGIELDAGYHAKAYERLDSN